MKTASTTLSLALAATALAMPARFIGKRAASPTDLGVPADCLKHGSVPVGWLPDQDAGVNMDAITNELGAKACFYGIYSQIESSTYDDSQLTARLDDVKNSGAVFQPAVMPTKVKFADITPDLADQIAASMKKFTDEGITVWLRFAHEVNWYVTPTSGPNQEGPEYVGGTPEEFVTAWQNVANAVKDNDKVFMFWSPNQASPDDLTPWFPGKDYVDITGIDIYPKDGKVNSFKDTYGAFYDAFAGANDLPFAIGETAVGGKDLQTQWLTDLANGDSSMPNYVGFAWFEYDKEADFRVVTGPEGDIAKSILEG